MSAIVATIKGSNEPIIIAAKNIVSIRKCADRGTGTIVVTTTVGQMLLEDSGTFDTLLKWFESFLKLETER